MRQGEVVKDTFGGQWVDKAGKVAVKTSVKRKRAENSNIVPYLHCTDLTF